jgi:hypothetical protein
MRKLLQRFAELPPADTRDKNRRTVCLIRNTSAGDRGIKTFRTKRTPFAYAKRIHFRGHGRLLSTGWTPAL